MVRLVDSGIYLLGGREILTEEEFNQKLGEDPPVEDLRDFLLEYSDRYGDG